MGPVGTSVVEDFLIMELGITDMGIPSADEDDGIVVSESLNGNGDEFANDVLCPKSAGISIG